MELKQLKIRNFKGIKALDINFDGHKEYNIFGANETGKTTIIDAWTWLLFGKDSQNRTDFSIKPIENGEYKHNIIVEVEGLIKYNEVELKLKRELHEKWIKKRGEVESTFMGHEIKYYINDVLCKKQDYINTINNIINERLFRLLTEVRYFNEVLSWQERRQMLFELIENITDKDIARGNKDFEELINLLESKQIKNTNQFRKNQVYIINKLKKDLQEIPLRIEENQRAMPEMIDNEDEINHQIAELQEQMIKIEKQIQNKEEQNKERYKKINDLRYEISQIDKKILELKNKYDSELIDKENDIKLTIQNLDFRILKIKDLIDNKKKQLEQNKKEMDIKNKELEELRKEYIDIQKEEIIFSEKDFICPCCKRKLDSDSIDEKKKKLEENFNKEKIKKLSFIKDKGLIIRKELDKYDRENKLLERDIKNNQQEYENLKWEINNWQKKLQDIQKNIKENNRVENKQEYKDLINQKQVLLRELEIIEKQEDKSLDKIKEQLLEQKNSYNNQILELKKQIERNKMAKYIQERINELKKKQKAISQEIADNEKLLYTIEQFIKTKINYIENKINEKFRFVKFKLYKKQINEGEREICEALIKDIPYKDANNASRINAGIDIINTFARHYGIHCPIFIDNAESINKLINTDSQIIRLVVIQPPKDDKERKFYQKYGLLLNKNNIL
ncbi:MAG: AAA family ATPase [Promethearchaeota archaeon]